MKKEERLLRALGNVRDGYVAESAKYMEAPETQQLVKPNKKKWQLQYLSSEILCYE